MKRLGYRPGLFCCVQPITRCLKQVFAVSNIA
jgi:hypothetical protein